MGPLEERLIGVGGRDADTFFVLIVLLTTTYVYLLYGHEVNVAHATPWLPVVGRNVMSLEPFKDNSAGP